MSVRTRAISNRELTPRESSPRTNRSSSPIRDRQNVRNHKTLGSHGNEMEQHEQQHATELVQETSSTPTSTQFTVNILAEFEALRKQVAAHQERWDEFDDLRAELVAMREEHDSLKQQLEEARATIEQLQKESFVWSEEAFPALEKQQQQQQHDDMHDGDNSMAIDPTGIAASKWAHPHNQLNEDGVTRAKKLQEKQQARRVQQHQQKQQQKQKQQPATFAAIAQCNTKPRRHRVITAPSEAMVAWATRGFQEASGDTGYTFVYLNSPHGMPHSEVRKRLRVLGIEQAHILDIHFPTTGYVGFLIYKSYEILW